MLISFYYGSLLTFSNSQAPSVADILRADTFTHSRFYTQTLLHTKGFYTHRPSGYTNTFTRRCVYTQTLLRTDTNAFTHRGRVHRTAQYHVASNSMLHLILQWKFPHKLPKKLSTVMPWRSNADLILLWNVQNTVELRTTASEIAAPKPDLDTKADKRRFRSTF